MNPLEVYFQNKMLNVNEAHDLYKVHMSERVEEPDYRTLHYIIFF